jgi:hypothetical protein
MIVFCLAALKITVSEGLSSDEQRHVPAMIFAQTHAHFVALNRSVFTHAWISSATWEFADVFVLGEDSRLRPNRHCTAKPPQHRGTAQRRRHDGQSGSVITWTQPALHSDAGSALSLSASYACPISLISKSATNGALSVLCKTISISILTEVAGEMTARHHSADGFRPMQIARADSTSRVSEHVPGST